MFFFDVALYFSTLKDPFSLSKTLLLLNPSIVKRQTHLCSWSSCYPRLKDSSRVNDDPWTSSFGFCWFFCFFSAWDFFFVGFSTFGNSFRFVEQPLSHTVSCQSIFLGAMTKWKNCQKKIRIKLPLSFSVSWSTTDLPNPNSAVSFLPV